MRHFLIALGILSVCSMQSAFAADSPKSLASELQSAISAKDLGAASKLVEWGQAPVAAYRLFKMSIADCFSPAVCKIEVVEMTEEEKKPQLDYRFTTVPEGQLKVISSDGEEGFRMPFAKVNTTYKIIIGSQTPEAYAQTKAATDAKKIAQEMDPDLLSNGQLLPADGGEPSAAYREYLAAIARGDKAYLAQHGTVADKYFFGNAYKDNPVKAEVAMDLAKMESITTPTLKGGFIKDNRALLLVSGPSGQGWTTEGAVLLMQEGGKWVIEDKSYLSYPPSHG